MTENPINYYTDKEKQDLSCCRLCPRECQADRLSGKTGFCNSSALEINIALITCHKGEEPVLSRDKGVCNVFFSHCNCQCIFCQNYKISQNSKPSKSLYPTMKSVVDRIEEVLKESENILGFVSPTHQIPLMKVIIREVRKRGLTPKIVYNSNGYDSVEQLRELEDVVDIYLPDFKYATNDIAKKFSAASDYPEKALAAIKEMYRQKGSALLTDADDNIESGLIIRHLLLPGHVEESKKVFDLIADEISANVHMSVMAQYAPPFEQPYKELNRKITQEEYDELKEYFFDRGFHRGWFQQLSSTESCIPDFDNNRFLNQ